MSQELLWSKVTQGLVGANRVVGPLPGFKFAVELGDRERAGGDLISRRGEDVYASRLVRALLLGRLFSAEELSALRVGLGILRARRLSQTVIPL